MTTGPQMINATAPLASDVWRECLAMMRFAFASGFVVPTEVAQMLEGAGDNRAPADTEGQVNAGGLPPPASDTPAPGDLARLAVAHARLSALIAPASPRTVLMMDERRNSRGYFNFLGPVRLVRYLLVVAAACLTAFVLLAMSSDINDASGDIFESTGRTVLVNELFFLSAAGAGAAFAGLFKAQRYIATGTFDPAYESSYWVQFTLGLIAGLLLATLIPINEGPDGTTGSELGRPLLALVGGFSATVVYRILERLVQTVESLVAGDARDMLAAREQESRARAAERDTRARLSLVAPLMQLQANLQAGATPEQISQEVTRLLNVMLPVDPLTAGGAPSAADQSRVSGGSDQAGGTTSSLVSASPAVVAPSS